MQINLTIIFYVLVVVAMIAFILVQRSPGATAGSAFGAGASATVFGAKGSGNFLTKTTMLLAFLFFAISMMMAVQAKKEFSAVNSGEVDLGVVGTLDSDSSDVPSITPVEPVESDLPAINNELNNSLETGVDSAENLINHEATNVQNNVNENLQNLKEQASEVVGDATAKANDAVDQVNDAKAELKEELKDPEK